MEAPKPEGLSKSNTLIALKEINRINFQIKIEENQIYISFETKESLIPKLYEGIFTREEIQKNKYFLQFDTLEEIFEELVLKYKIDFPKVTKKDENYVLKISLSSSKFKDIEFILKPREKNAEDKFKELYSIVAELKNENFELRQEINNIKNENFAFKEKIKILISLNKTKKAKTNTEKKSLYDSSILKDDEEKMSQLIEFISPNKKIESELKYQMTRDGTDFETFHELCDNVSPNLLLIKDDKDNIFGGYTTVAWEAIDFQKNDPESFLFSLTKNKKYCPKHKEGNHIYCYSFYGPRFCSGNLSFQNYNMSTCMSTRKGEYLDESLSSNKSGYYFKVKEIEFYQIVIN